MTSGHRPAEVSPAGRSPAHGFCDDEMTRRLLHSRPPRQALAWAAAQLGGPVTSARALRGGMSSAVHLLTTQDRAGQRRQAVLRRYVRPELNAEEPDIAAREARALRVAGSVGVPTPALLGVDPSGDGAGVPAVLMSRLPSRVDWWPSDTGRWLRRLAGVLPAIHAAPLPPAGLIGPFAACPQASYQPPAWARYPAVWERAAEIHHGPAPCLPACGDAAPRLPSRQRAVAMGQRIRGGRLAGRMHRSGGGRRGALPGEPADLRHRGGRAVHRPVAARGRCRLPPVGGRGHHHRLPRRPARRMGLRAAPGRGHARPRRRRTRSPEGAFKRSRRGRLGKP